MSNPLSPEERVLLAKGFDAMMEDAIAGDQDAIDRLSDSFWVFYADLILGSHARVMRAIERLTAERKAGIIISREARGKE